MWKSVPLPLLLSQSGEAFVLPSPSTTSLSRGDTASLGGMGGGIGRARSWNDAPLQLMREMNEARGAGGANGAREGRWGRERRTGWTGWKGRKGRNGSVCLNGPLNVMSMEQENVLLGLFNETDSVLDLVDASTLATYSASDFFPKELAVVEEDVGVKKSETVSIQETKEVKGTKSKDSTQRAETNTNALDYPSIKKIVKFSLPAIGVWLCSPVLSMIDTASVGLLAGTAQQAALNPAVSVTDYGALLVAFMYTATTNLIAASQEKDSHTPGNPQTTKTLVTALRLALIVGISFSALLFTSAPLLLKLLIGNDSIDPNVFSAALRYVQIRCLGMPAAVVIGTAQSGCLGMQDVKSPLYVLAAAAGINLVGDLILVRNGNPWLGGAAGAAWATVMSQYGALFMFLKWLTAKPKKNVDDTVDSKGSMITNINKGAQKMIKVIRGSTLPNTPKTKVVRRTLLSTTNQQNHPTPQANNQPPNPKNNQAPAKGFLTNKLPTSQILNILSLDKPTARSFLPFILPVTTTSIGRVSGYISMSHVASSALGTLDMAAHQIAISIFCCLAPVVDALNQVAQSFVPGIFARSKSKERAVALRKTSVNFAKVGASFGGVIVGLVTMGVPILSRFFTTDPEVLVRVRNAIPGIAVFLGFDGLMCIGEGTLLGQNDLAFLRNMYASFFFIVPAFMLRLKHKALSGIPVGIGTLWGTFSVYEVVRTCLWLLRVVQLQLRTEKEAKELETGV